MEPNHCEIVEFRFRTSHEKIKVLHISDIYARYDPELIQELKNNVISILDTSASSNHQATVASELRKRNIRTEKTIHKHPTFHGLG
jgi:hypothetical protein